jgi:hypothetical protein
VILPSRLRRRGARRLTAAGIFILALAGCASAPVQRVSGAAGLPERAELQTVPFYPQEDYQCGPAALAMVLSANGKPVDPAVLKPQVYLPDRHGSLQIEMLASARRNGFVALELRPELAGVFAEIASGHPVIVLQNLAFDWYPLWHYAVAVGYDLEAQHITLRSGRDRRVELPLDVFDKSWRGGGRWAMLALPPDVLPASVAEAEYAKAVAKLERTGQTVAAAEAYRSALNRWPDNLVALIGLGNIRYAAGDLGGAERSFRRAAKTHPTSTAAHNNLAQTLADMGRYDEALAEARSAVDLGGPLHDVSVRTLAAIMARTGGTEQEWHQ